MRKHLTAALALTLMAAVVYAEPIDREAARDVARHFIDSRSTTSTGRRNVRATSQELTPVQLDAQQPFYVFNVGRDAGFVIVSGDDAAEPVLGYADSGSFDPATMPDNMRGWLEGISAELRTLEKAAQPARRAQQTTKRYIATMIQTSWNQNDPYNRLCPLVGGTRTVTGCVATALAQVMKYHEWPRAALARDIPGTYSPQVGVPGSTVSAGLTLSWDAMNTYYNANETVGNGFSETAVAQLMLACGVSVEMGYGTGVSGAVLAKTATALKTYFDYCSNARHVERANYSYDTWLDMMYAELANGRPVIYGGASSSGGHAFVLDGYDGGGLFHINWGWGGLSDGYYVLSVCNPESNTGIGASNSSDGYSQEQDAVIGIWPNDVFRPYPGDDNGEEEVIRLTTNGVSISGTTITMNLSNNTGEDGTFDTGVGYVDGQGTVQLLTRSNGFQNWQLPNGYGWNQISATVSASVFSSLGLPDGAYKLVTLSKFSSENTWHTDLNPEKQYILATVAGGSVTLEDHFNARISLALAGFSTTSTPQEGRSLELVANIRNDGDEYYGTFYLYNSSGALVAQAGATVRAGETRPVSFYFTPTSAGSQTFAVVFLNGGSYQQLGQVTINVTEQLVSGADLAVTAISYDNDNAASGVLYGKKISGRITVRNNHTSAAFDGAVSIRWFYNTEGGVGSFSSFRTDSYNVTIPAGTSQDIPFEMDDVTVGYAYWPFVIALNTQISDDAYGKNIRVISAGVTAYHADGTTTTVTPASSLQLASDVTAIDLTGVQGVTSVSAGNPNTLFFIGSGDAAPDSRQYNVVRDGVCEYLAIADGYDFATPTDFEATTASYTRTFAEGYDRHGSGGWTTVVFPFDVDNVKALYQQGFYDIDWFHTDADTQKNFWIMAFTYEEDGNVNFTQARDVVAYQPYIIAVPNTEWGEATDLTNTTMTFIGHHAFVEAGRASQTMGQRFRMCATMQRTTVADAYVMNAEGNKFAYQRSATVTPFRAYFLSNEGFYYDTMPIRYVGKNPTSVGDLQPDLQTTAADAPAPIYDLSGRRIATDADARGLKPGIYVSRGRKMIHY